MQHKSFLLCLVAFALVLASSFAAAVDTTPPTISNLFPANGSTAGANTIISADLNDSETGVNTTGDNNIIMMITSVPAGPNDATYIYKAAPQLVYTGTSAQGTLRFTPTANFTSGAVTIDLSARDNNGNNANIVWNFTVDATAPADITGLVAIDQSNGTDVKLIWNPSPDANLNTYKVYKDTNPITDVSGLSVVASTGDVNQYTVGALTAGTLYYFAVTAVDDFGNEDKTVSNTASLAPTDTVAPAVPTGLGTSAGNGQITVNWSANSEGDLANYRLWRSTSSDVATALNITSPSKTSTSHTDSNLNNGTAYYYWLSAVDNSGNESGKSSVASATPQVPDTTAPATPSGLSATTGNTQVTVSWTANTESDLANYRLWRNTTSDATNASNIVSPAKADTSYTNTGLTNGTNYFYWLSAVDTSGNESGKSAYASATPTASCSDGTSASTCSPDKPMFCNAYYVLVEECTVCGCPSGYICDADTEGCVRQMSCSAGVAMEINDEERPAYAGAGTLNVSVTSTGKLYDAELRTFMEGEGYDSLDIGDGITELSGSHAVAESSDGNRLLVELTGNDSTGVGCGQRVWMDVDTKKPTLSVLAPLSNSSLKGTYEFRAEADDSKSGIRVVEFYYNALGVWKKIAGIIEPVDGVYSYKWDTAGAENGSTQAKVIAKDKAGNSTEEIIDVKIANIVSKEDEAALAIDDAGESKEAAERAIISLEKLAVLPNELISLIETAQNSMQAAESAFGNKDYTNATTNAQTAADAYNDAAEYMKAYTYKQAKYSIDKEKAESQFAAAGLDASLAAKAAEALNENAVSREIIIVRIASKGKTYYQENVILKFKNNSGSAKAVKIVEIIPKEFYQKASPLQSAVPFTVIVNDPVISFDLGTVAAGEEVTVIYGLPDGFSQEEADSLAIEETIKKFVAPPAVIPGDASLGSSFGGFLGLGLLFSGAGLASLLPSFSIPTMPELGAMGFIGTLIGSLAVIAIVLAVVAIALFIKNRHDYAIEVDHIDSPLKKAAKKIDSPLGRATVSKRNKVIRPRSRKYSYKGIV